MKAEPLLSPVRVAGVLCGGRSAILEMKAEPEGAVELLLVSACLAGLNCRYDGGHKCHPVLEMLVREGRAVPVCPEQLGGLPIPRPPAEIQGATGVEVLEGRARVLDRTGRDVTEAFRRGAEKTLEFARRAGVRTAVLKEGSPSCGSSAVYDGSFSGSRRPGAGVTAALLRQQGIAVYSEQDFPELLARGWPGGEGRAGDCGG